MRSSLPLAAVVLLGVPSLALAQTPSGWRAHDLTRPRPPVVVPGQEAAPVRPPADAVVLFDGSGVSAWRNANGEPAGWVVRDGAMEAVPGAGYVFSEAGVRRCPAARGVGSADPAEGHGAGAGEQRRLPDGYVRTAGARFLPQRHLPGRASRRRLWPVSAAGECLAPPGGMAVVRHRLPPATVRFRRSAPGAGPDDRLSQRRA